MKNNFFYYLLFCFVICLGCSKDNNNETPALPSQYPMKTLIENGVLDLNSTINSPNTFELGYQFKTFKNGKIKSVSIRVPSNDTYRVSLWNFDTEELLLTQEVQSSNGLISTKEINPITINSSVNYFISVNTNDYYAFNKGGAVIFPTDIGDVLVKAYGSYLGTNQAIPTTFSTTFYLGMVDFEFVPNN